MRVSEGNIKVLTKCLRGATILCVSLALSLILLCVVGRCSGDHPPHQLLSGQCMRLSTTTRPPTTIPATTIKRSWLGHCVSRVHQCWVNSDLIQVGATVFQVGIGPNAPLISVNSAANLCTSQDITNEASLLYRRTETFHIHRYTSQTLP